jgi:hypothetical protein
VRLFGWAVQGAWWLKNESKSAPATGSQTNRLVSLAQFGHIDDVLREGLPSTLGMAINP